MKTYYRLPTGNTIGEFQSLYNQYPTYDQMRKYPVGMVLGGYYSWGFSNLNAQETDGDYYSSSVSTNITFAYQLYLNGNNSLVDPANGYVYRYSGVSLRCLACRLVFISPLVWCR